MPLEKLDNEGVPAIVLINERGYHHFVVVKGYKNGRVLVGDPARGTAFDVQATLRCDVEQPRCLRHP